MVKKKTNKQNNEIRQLNNLTVHIDQWIILRQMLKLITDFYVHFARSKSFVFLWDSDAKIYV